MLNENKKQTWKTLLPCVLIVGIFLASAVATVGDYGVDWDSPENFDVGEIYFNFFRTFDFTYLKFDTTNPLFGHLLRPELSLHQPASYLPAANICAALTQHVFHDILGWVDRFSGYHLSIIFFACGLLFLVYFFALKEYDLKTAIVSTISLSLFPSFISFSHMMVKDIPMAFFFALSLITLKKAYVTKSLPWVVVAGIILGLSFNVKINAIAVPFIFIFWVVLVERRKAYLAGLFQKKWLLLPLFATLTIYLSWPLLWQEPLHNLKCMLLHFLKDVPAQHTEVLYRGEIYTSGINVPWHYAPFSLAMRTPVAIFVLGLIGFCLMVRDVFVSRHKTSALILLWFIFPMLKFIFSNVTYSGIRLFFEIVPALCLMAGIGAKFIYETIFHIMGQINIFYKHVILSLLLAVLFLPVLLADIKTHPHQQCFFNNLVGGPRGVYTRKTAEVYSDCSPLVAGKWFNEHAPLRSVVKATGPIHILRLYLRSDITIADANEIQYNYLLLPYDVHYGRYPSHSIVSNVTLKEDDIVFRETVMGAPVVVIYKNSGTRK